MHSLHITKANEGEHLLVGADVATIKAANETTTGSMLVFETRVLPGGGPPMLHRHAYAEVFYVLHGEFEISTLDNNNRQVIHTVKTGDTIAIPSMAWHTFKNGGAAHGTFLTIHSPPVTEPLIHEIGVPVEDPLHPPMGDGPPLAEERERFMSLIGQYIEMLPPDAIAR